MTTLTTQGTVTAGMTYEGMKMSAEFIGATINGLVLLGLLSLCIGLMVFSFWRTVFAAFSYYRSPIATGIALVVAMVFLVLIFFISSWFNVTMLAGKDAMDIHASHLVAEVEDEVDIRTRDARQVAGLLPDLAITSERYAREAEDEVSGARTGGKGTGTVSITLQVIANRVALMQVTVKEQLSQVDRLTSDARDNLAALRTIAGSTSLSPRQKIDRMGPEYDRLRSILSELDQANLNGFLIRELSSLPDETTSRRLSARTKAGKLAQRQALAEIASDLEALAKRLTADLDGQRAPRKVPTLERLNPVTAVFRYMDRLIPYWVAGIGVDIFPLCILLFILADRMTKTPEEQAWDTLGNLTVNEIIRGSLGANAIRDSGADPQIGIDLQNQVLPRKLTGPKGGSS